MIGWALDNIYIPTRTIFNPQKVAIGSFRLKHLQVLYTFSLVSNFIYNAKFLEEFNKKEYDQYENDIFDF